MDKLLINHYCYNLFVCVCALLEASWDEVLVVVNGVGVRNGLQAYPLSLGSTPSSRERWLFCN